jgi:hypothetical protein
LQFLTFDPANQQPSPIINDASLDAVWLPGYSNKSANKNPITSRSSSGSGRNVHHS